MLFRSLKNQPKIHFTLTIDYNDQLKTEGLILGEQHIVLPNNSKHEFPVAILIKELESYLQKYLPKEIYYSFGFRVRIQLEGNRKGSIVIVFSMILASYYGVSKYKNFVESVQLIRKHVQWLIQNFLDSRFRGLLIVKAKSHTVARNSTAIFGFNYAIVSTLIGVLLGATITGYFSLRTQKLENSQQLMMFNRQQTIAERFELKEVLTEYVDVIISYIDLINDSGIDLIKIRDFDRNAFKAAFHLSLFVNAELGSKSFEINSMATDLLHKQLSGELKPEELKLFTDEVSNWIISAKIELKYLKYTANPDNLEKDLLRLLINSVELNRNKETKGK